MIMPKKRVLVGFVVFLVLIFLFFAYSAYEFYTTLENREVELQKEVMDDTSHLITAYINTKLEDYLYSLYDLTGVLDGTPMELDSVMEILKRLLRKSDFYSLGYVTREGNLYSTDGMGTTVTNISYRSYWPSLLNNESVVSNIMDDAKIEKNKFVIAVPITSKDGTVLGALHGSISVDDFQRDVLEKLSIKQYAVLIINRKGDFVFRDPRSIESWNYQNIFDEFSEVGDFDKVDTIKSDLEVGNLLQVQGDIAGTEYMLGFYPLTVNLWYTVVAVPVDSLKRNLYILLDNHVWYLILRIIIPSVLFFIIVIIYLKRLFDSEKDKEIQLRERLFAEIQGFIQFSLLDGRILYCSDSLKIPSEERTSFSKAINYYINNFVYVDSQDCIRKAVSLKNLRDIYYKGIKRLVQEYQSYDEKGSICWTQSEIHVSEETEREYPVLYYIIKNIDERKQMEMSLKQRAERDGLTGLYNRTAGMERINNFLTFDSMINNHEHLFVILDLDNFKKLNDTLLHETGDIALQDVAKTLKEFFREDDIVCRLGGDEFVVFLKNTSFACIKGKIENLLSHLQLTYTRDNVSVSISASAGVVSVPKDGTNFKDLYTAADKALYEAKKTKKGSFKTLDDLKTMQKDKKDC